MDVVKNRATIEHLRKNARRIPFFWKFYWLYWRLRSWLESRRVYNLDRELVDFGSYAKPSLEYPTSQLCTANQCYEKTYLHWCKTLDSPSRFMRKQWEYVYIMQVLRHLGYLNENTRGLGFGCGKELLAGIFAKKGCHIVATDLSQKEAMERGWVETMQHSSDLDELYLSCNKVIDKKTFTERVSFQNVDMNAIPNDLTGFDFVWSACAFEHLGSLEHGMDFVKNAMKCLKPGGVAVHTTEFNLSSNEDTFETEGCSVYRKKDIDRLVKELEAEGYVVSPVNYHTGNMNVDKYIDVPPYGFSPHLKLLLENYVVTSIGLIIKRPG